MQLCSYNNQKSNITYDESENFDQVIKPALNIEKIEQYTQNTQNGIKFKKAIFGAMDVLDVDNKNDINNKINENMTFQYNVCSKACCTPQYPTPFSVPVDPMTCGSIGDFVPSNYTCNNGWQDTGCLCLTREQSDFLNNRGNNI
jgi:hypothetical protein